MLLNDTLFLPSHFEWSQPGTNTLWWRQFILPGAFYEVGSAGGFRKAQKFTQFNPEMSVIRAWAFATEPALSKYTDTKNKLAGLTNM